MTGEERREVIYNMLQKSDNPISGSEFAKKLNVSRQVIVQDVALLRAQNIDVMATARGYLLYSFENKNPKRVISVQHNSEFIQKELEIIVDQGGKILDVIIEHDVYGQIKADLLIESRKDLKDFIDKMESTKALPLMALTKGMHFHTIEAKSEAILDQIEKKLIRLNKI